MNVRDGTWRRELKPPLSSFVVWGRRLVREPERNQTPTRLLSRFSPIFFCGELVILANDP
jgi:hypothetical protein